MSGRAGWSSVPSHHVMYDHAHAGGNEQSELMTERGAGERASSTSLLTLPERAWFEQASTSTTMSG